MNAPKKNKTTNQQKISAAAVLASLPRLAYKPEEAAVIIGVNKFTVYRLIKRGLLKSSSALRHKLIPLAEIERFLKSTTN